MVHLKALSRPAMLAGVLLALTCSPTRAAVPVWENLAGEIGRTALRWLSGSLANPETTESRVERRARKHGCSIDPAGQSDCALPVTPKSGCSIDPNGKPNCAP